MGRVPDQEQLPILHGLTGKRAQWRDTLFEAGPGHEARRCIRGQPTLQYLPGIVITPVIYGICQGNLQVLA